MKEKFDVYGLGNALVDIVLEVPESFLTENKMDKGLMTLIDQKKHKELLDTIEIRAIKNHTVFRRSCGGSVANSMICISQLGGKAFFSCKVANDDSGTFFYDDLEKAGVLTNVGERRQDGTTGTSMIFVTPDSENTKSTHLGITETITTDELDNYALKNSQYLYIEGYLAASPTAFNTALQAIKTAKKNKVKVALTLSDPNMVTHYKEKLEELIGEGIDLLICSQKEAFAFTGTENLDRAIDELKLIANIFVITMGEKGALIFNGKDAIHVKGRKVNVQDETGARDVFAGSFLYAITNGFSLAKAGQLACFAASELLTKFGARLTRPQINSIAKEVMN